MADEIDRSNQYLKVFKKDGTFVAAGEKGTKVVEAHKMAPNTVVADGDYKLAFDEIAGETPSKNLSNFLDAKGITVPPIHVTGIALDKTTLALETGQTANLKATVSPANATNKAYSWSSDNTAVATVDSNGKVTAVKAGTAKVTVKTADGAKTAVCTITITDPVIEVTGVTLDKTTAEVEEGATLQLKATVAPANATNKAVEWKPGNPECFTIDNNGKVTGVKAGQATAVVTTKDGSKTAECKVTVTAKSEPEPDPEPPAEGGE